MNTLADIINAGEDEQNIPRVLVVVYDLVMVGTNLTSQNWSQSAPNASQSIECVSLHCYSAFHGRDWQFSFKVGRPNNLES